MKKIMWIAVKDFLRRVRAWHDQAPMRTWICLIAFTVSFGYALIYQITPSVDARKFHTIAVNLVTTQTFCYECDVPLVRDTAIRDIGPAYQFFLASVYSLFGIHPWIVWALQAFMHAIVVVWIWRLIDQVTKGYGGQSWMRIVPVMLYAVHPDIVQGNAMLMADGLFSFLFMACIIVFLPYLEVKTPTEWKRSAFLGALIGVLAMVKPTGLPLFIAIIVVLAWRKLWKSILIAISFFIIVQTPWAIRNVLTYDHFIYNSVVGGLDMWVGVYPKGTGEFNLDTLPEITQRIQGLAPEELDRVALTEAKKIIVEQPAFVLQRTASKFFKLFAITKTSGFWFHYFGSVDHSLTVLLSVLFNALLLTCAGAAILLAGIKRVFTVPILCVCIIAIGLLAAAPTLTVVVNRYRIPMLPFITVLATYWLIAASTWRERLMTLGGSIGFLVLCTSIDLWGSWNKVIDRLSRIRQ